MVVINNGNNKNKENGKKQYESCEGGVWSDNNHSSYFAVSTYGGGNNTGN